MSAQFDSTAETVFSEEEVLRRIEQAVLDHRLTPGTKLKEVKLAELFGVKRGLIRKVLTRLAHSSLVVQTPNRGATVARP
jgi:DNA-binding GntR family transcriptional regulator